MSNRYMAILLLAVFVLLYLGGTVMGTLGGCLLVGIALFTAVMPGKK